MLKRIKIDEQIHRKVKATAAMHGVTIREWVERVLQNAIAAEGMMLVDPGVEYTAKGDDDANG